MVIKHHLHGYEQFCQFAKTLEGSNAPKAPVYFLFSGSEDESGVNWCPYCVTAAPVVEEGLKLAPDGSIFVHVTVGDRDYWKDPNCPFRSDERTKLIWVPTLLRWKTDWRLDSRHVSDAQQVNELFAQK